MENAIIEFEDKLGVRPVFGGVHSSFGTKNALIKLDNGTYLELLAADESNTQAVLPRWMGLDLLKENQITRWAMRSSQLNADSLLLKSINPEMGLIREGSRNLPSGGQLQWDLIMPLSHPEVELLPFMVNWDKSKLHPTDVLKQTDCRLIELFGMHPTPEKFKNTFKQLDIDFRITKSSEVKLKAIIECPKGHVEI